MRERTWRARWWRPEGAEHAVWGDLHFSDDEFELQLDGSLPREYPEVGPGTQIAGFFEPAGEPVLLGRTRRGELFTLLDCYGYVPSLPFGEAYDTWTPRTGLFGVNLERPELCDVVAARVQLDSLSQWAGVHTVELSLSEDRSLGRITRVEVAAEREELGVADVDAGTVRLVRDLQFTTKGTEAQVGASTHFEVELKSATPPLALIDEIQPLRDLVTFATLRPANVEVVRVRPRESESDQWAELLVRLTRRARPAEERPVHDIDMLFSAGELPGSFGEGLAKWYQLHARYSMVFRLLLGVSYAPFIYDDQRFLAFTQAAEVYHRTAIGGTPLPKNEHRSRVNEVSSHIDDANLRKWATRILLDSNYLHLRERLREVIGQLGEMGTRLAGEDVEDFIGRVVATRNFLTHRDVERQSPKVLESPARFWHGQALAWMLRLNLLLELEWDMEALSQRLKHNSSLRRVLEVMRSKS